MTGFEAATTSSIGSTMKRAAGLAAAAFAAAGVGTFFKDVINLSANAEQSIGGVEAVFKNYSKTVIAESKSADRALGLSGNAYRELATLIGAQLKNAGVPMDELGGKTSDLITMGADLAAMFGGTTADAVAAISSALKGEMDPIEKYGISLNQAALKAEAMALGLDTSGASLSNSTRAMAVMSLITKQGGDAIGAFGRESDTAAGRAQRAAAQWENLKTAIGDRLLPVWSGLMDFVGKVVLPGLSGVGTAIDSVVNFFGALTDVLIRGDFTSRFAEVFNVHEDSALVDFLFDVRESLSGVVNFVRDHATPILAGLGGALAVLVTPMILSAIGALAGALGGALLAAVGALLSPIGLLALAVGGIVAVFVAAYQESEPLRAAVEKLKDAFGIFFDAFDAANGAGGIQGFFDGLKAGISAAAPVVLEALSEMGTALWSWIKENIGPALVALGEWVASIGSWVWNEGLPALVGFMADLGQALIDWIAPRIGPALEQLSSWLSALGSWIWNDGLPMLGDAVSALGEKLVDWIGPRIGPMLTEIGTFLGSLVDWIWNTGIPWLWDTLVSLSTKLIEWIGPRIPEMLGKIGEFLGSLVNWIFDTGIPWLWETLVSLGQNLIEWITPRIPELLGKLGEFLGEAVGWVLFTGIPMLIGALLKLGYELITWVAPRIPELLGEFLGLMRDVVSWIFTDGLPMLFSALWEMGKGAIKGVWEAIEDSPLFRKLGEIFDKAVNIVEDAWDDIVEAVKKPIRVVFNFVNDKMISPVNSILDNFPGKLSIPYLPRLAEGGMVRGPGTPTSDSILGVDRRGIPTSLVSRDEFVVNARSTRTHRDLLEAINSGRLPGYARGGLVGGDKEAGGPWDWIKNTAGDVWDKATAALGTVKDFAVNMVKTGARKAAGLILEPLRDTANALIPNKVPLSLLEGGLNKLVDAVLGKGDEADKVLEAQRAEQSVPGPAGGPPGSGYNALFRVVKAAFPQARLNSGYRPGDPGYHGRGLAVDLGQVGRSGGIGHPYLAAMNQWIHDNFPRSRELIYDGAGDNRPDLKNGRPLTYNRGTQLAHRNHVHWVYDQGGLLEPGMRGINLSGKPERVLSPEQTESFDRWLNGNRVTEAAPLVGSLTIQVGAGADVRDGMEEAMFQLRRIKRGAGGRWT